MDPADLRLDLASIAKKSAFKRLFEEPQPAQSIGSADFAAGLAVQKLAGIQRTVTVARILG
jgi:hypothetical protein